MCVHFFFLAILTKIFCYEFQMTNIATLVKFGSKLSTYQGEIEYNKQWFDRNSKTIREIINPGSTNDSQITTTTSTEGPSKDDSNSSPRHSCIIILQILALSVSAKFLVL